MARPPIRAVLIDLSGTIQIGAQPTPRAAFAVQRLRDAHIPFRFCSNTSNESTRALTDRLHTLGIDVRNGELWTSLRAVGATLRARQCSRPFVLASESARREILDSVGAPADMQDAACDAVVLAYAPAQYDFRTLNAAFRVLMHEVPGHASAETAAPLPLPLFATHASRYVQAADGHLSLGPGPFVAALEYGAGVRAQIVGKPERAFFEMVLRSFDFVEGADEGRIVMVGDDVRGDLGGGAAECGLWRVLVRTGKYRPGDEAREGVLPPDEVCGSFADFVDSLLDG